MELHASNIRELLKLAERTLQQHHVPNAGNNAIWMLCDLMDWKMIDVYAHFNVQLSDDLTEEYAEMIERRAQREPLQYILGSTEFMSLRFHTRPLVFIPRPETETLVEVADTMLRGFPLHQPLSVLDLCCGSGIIGVSLAHRIGNLEVTSVDVSLEAVMQTAENADMNQVAPRLRVVQSDAFRYLERWAEEYTAILCNPPYIATGDLSRLPPEVREHEPMLALDGGSDGLDFYRRVIPLLRPRLARGGFAMFEIGDTQAGAVVDLLRGAGFA
jgi:release factor glutamine methyltransferase